jgi:hypothetical protein
MNRLQTLTHKFVEFVPEELEQGILYISIQYTTASHKCCCGCGFEVVTPISPDGWKFIFNGKTVSLEPSIGNWGFECQSHYWITRNQVRWAEKWSERRIKATQGIRRGEKASETADETRVVEAPQTDDKMPPPKKEGMWRRLKRKVRGQPRN